MISFKRVDHFGAKVPRAAFSSAIGSACIFLLFLSSSGCGGRIGSRGSTADVEPFSVVQLPVRSETGRFLFVGDTGLPSVHLFDGVMKVHRQTPIDAVLMLGDNFYPCGVKSVSDKKWAYFTKDLGRLGIPVFPVLGNHDYGNPPFPSEKQRPPCGDANPHAQLEASGKIANWKFPARNYVLSSGLVDIVMVDTSPIAYGWAAGLLGSATSSAVHDGLSRALMNSTARWKIVAGHHVLFSSGLHGAGGGTEIRNMRSLLPLLQSNRVDLFASGHDHHLELVGSIAKAPLFLISGAGARTRPYKRRKPSEPVTIFPQTPTPSFLGFTVVAVTSSNMNLTFYDINGAARIPVVTVTKTDLTHTQRSRESFRTATTF